VESIQIQGQDACLILPSEDQPADMSGQAGLIVCYTELVQVGGDVYHYFILWADRDHIREMTETLQFVVTPL
jgi:TolB protein